MSKMIEIRLPDIGDFTDVEVIEVLVAVGDQLQIDDSLITVESDKASMEIPSPYAGTVLSMTVKYGDHIAEGDLLMTLDVIEETTAGPSAEGRSAVQLDEVAAAVEPLTSSMHATEAAADITTEVVVLGAGPGGYTAAFRAADLGKQVLLIESAPVLGGVCLNVGCIPSKALLHVAEVVSEAQEFAELGVTFAAPTIDTVKLRAHKNRIVAKLTGGLKQLAKQRKVQVVHGYGRFTAPHRIEVEAADGTKQTIAFQHCIIAAGSSVTKPVFIPWDDPRVWDSSAALELQQIPKRMLIVGGGIIGLEMATVYHALGSEITIVERGTGLIHGADRDLIRPLEKVLKQRYQNIFLNTKLSAITPSSEGIVCRFEGDKKAPAEACFDAVLVAIGRSPNGALIDAERAGVQVNDHGFVVTDNQQRTNVDHIFAIGDIVGQPMLAHKATHEAKVAAEVIAGHKAYFDARTIPSVAYTAPEVAWCGQTEEQLKAEGVEYTKGAFPWAASGRALSVGAENGMTKLLFDKQSKRILGAGIVGKNAGELIAEAVLAIEMGANAEDIALSIHPHPTLSETLNFASEVAEGVCTDIYNPNRR